jgi:hypothetical protein
MVDGRAMPWTLAASATTCLFIPSKIIFYKGKKKINRCFFIKHASKSSCLLAAAVAPTTSFVIF